jgi:hypothetical protein
MQPQPPPFDPRALDAFVALVGARGWSARMAEIAHHARFGPRSGRAIRLRHALELAIDRLRGNLIRPASTAELHAARLAAETVALARRLSVRGRSRLRERLHAAMAGDGTLVVVFHLLRTASLQRSRGFDVRFAGLEDDAPYDLLLTRGQLAAEIACDVVSADDGRLLQRRSWSRLADQVDTELRRWIGVHPGRYLLKMTLPHGLRDEPEGHALNALHERIRRLLATQGRRDHDAMAVMRLDPLLLANSRPDDTGLLPSLRREFGPEAHLSVTATSGGLIVMAARAGRADEVAVAVRRRLFDIAPTRLSGTRPGILAMFIDDADRDEWRGLRDSLELEGEARQFLAYQSARQIVAVTCASRCELFGMPAPDAVEDGELRFRNPAHPKAKAVELASAVLSSV